MKPIRGELRARVELLAKKRRNVKRKARDPSESSLPARGKVLKLGISDPRSFQVQVKGQELSSLTGVSEVVGAQRRSSSTAGVKGYSRKAIEPPLKVLPISVWSPSVQNASPLLPTWGDVGGDRFEAEGG